MTSEQQALLRKAQRSLEAAQSLIQQGFYDFAVSAPTTPCSTLQRLFSIEKSFLFPAMLRSLVPLDNT